MQDTTSRGVHFHFNALPLTARRNGESIKSHYGHPPTPTSSHIYPPTTSHQDRRVQCTLIQLVQTQGTVFLRRSIHFSDAPEFLRCSTKIDPTTVDLSDAVIISQMLRENVLEWLTYLYHSHQFYILYGMGDSSRWSASD